MLVPSIPREVVCSTLLRNTSGERASSRGWGKEVSGWRKPPLTLRSRTARSKAAASELLATGHSTPSSEEGEGVGAGDAVAAAAMEASTSSTAPAAPTSTHETVTVHSPSPSALSAGPRGDVWPKSRTDSHQTVKKKKKKIRAATNPCLNIWRGAQLSLCTYIYRCHSVGEMSTRNLVRSVLGCCELTPTPFKPRTSSVTEREGQHAENDRERGA